MKPEQKRGFTLIELLIVVAIIGIIAAIAVPGLVTAMDRGRQKRTMADMRALGTAVEQYAIDFTKYPQSLNGTVRATVAPLLEPAYAKKCPDNDGWGTPFHWTSDAAGAVYSVVSYGKGGQPGGGSPGPTKNFTDDIIFSCNNFTQWPEGQQR